MGLAMVFVDAIGTDVPAAVVAAGHFLKTAVAKEWAAQEELLQANARLVVERARIERQMQLVAAAFAVDRVKAR